MLKISIFFIPDPGRHRLRDVHHHWGWGGGDQPTARNKVTQIGDEVTPNTRPVTRCYEFWNNSHLVPTAESRTTFKNWQNLMQFTNKITTTSAQVRTFQKVSWNSIIHTFFFFKGILSGNHLNIISQFFVVPLDMTPQPLLKSFSIYSHSWAK